MLRRIRLSLFRLGFNGCSMFVFRCLFRTNLQTSKNEHRKTNIEHQITDIEASFFNSSKHLLHKQLPSYSHSVILAMYSVSALVKTAFIQSHCKILLTLQTNISPHLGQESGACFSMIIVYSRKSSFKRLRFIHKFVSI